MLVGAHVPQGQDVAFLDRRQLALGVLVLLVVPILVIDGHETGLDQRRAGRAESPDGGIFDRQQVERDLIEQGMHHLAGHGAFPDQAVQLELIRGFRCAFSCSGVRPTLVGRIASCASCAFLDLVLYTRASSGRFSAP